MVQALSSKQQADLTIVLLVERYGASTKQQATSSKQQAVLTMVLLEERYGASSKQQAGTLPAVPWVHFQLPSRIKGVE